jgi:uncharacterized BrkB/YihY/UPF0761 family membrane protein
MRARVEAVSRRVTAQRARHRSLDTAFEIVDTDLEVGGGIIAGALAYRLFVWLLPLALVVIAGLGLASDLASTSPEAAASSMSLASLVSQSVAGAAESPTRWYALVVGLPALVLATRSVLRVLIGAHRLVWGEVRRPAHKPTFGATMRLLGLFAAFYLVTGAAHWLQARELGIGLLALVAAPLGYGAVWLLISMRLPHRGPWQALLPGAVFFALGMIVLEALGAYVIQPYALNKQGTYGALGIAAVMLVALFMIGRLMVATAVINATVWDRRAVSDRSARRSDRDAVRDR